MAVVVLLLAGGAVAAVVRWVGRRPRPVRQAPPPPVMVCPECFAEPSISQYLDSLAPVLTCDFCEPPRPAGAELDNLVDRLIEDGLGPWRFVSELRPGRDGGLFVDEVLAEMGNPVRNPELVEALTRELDFLGSWHHADQQGRYP